MNWKNMTIGKKIGLGFGTILVLLIVVGSLSFTGVGGIVTNAKEVIYGNKLDGTLAQKEVDHLNWVNHVNALLTDSSITHLDVQTDHKKCAFGKWLYSDERYEAEKHIKGLDELFKGIESPHQHLHESAVEIKTVFKNANPELPSILQARIIDHLNWAAKLENTFLMNLDSVSVNTDAATCALGKWLTSEEAKKVYHNSSDQYKSVWDKMVKDHTELHQSALAIKTAYKIVKDPFKGPADRSSKMVGSRCQRHHQ